MKAAREGSRKASVQSAFNKDGADAAVQVGTSLGLKLGTIKSWLNAWSKDNGAGPVKVKDPSPVKAKGESTRKTVEVNYVKNPDERKAYLIAQGPQASIVRFVHNGIEQCIGNDFLGLPMEVRGKE